MHIKKLVVLLCGILIGHTAQASGKHIRNVAGAAAGIYSSIYVHELGHAIAFHARGAEDVRIHIPGRHCKIACGMTSARDTQVHSAAVLQLGSASGFLAANIASELALQNESVARSGFGQGFLAANLYSNGKHVFDYYTKIRGRNGYRGNDIDAYEMSGGNPHLLSAGLLAYSVVSLHRMKKKGIPVMFLQLRF